MLFRDRRDAGRQLAQRLTQFAHRSDVVVLGLPRGGVPVAFEVAQALDVPLDVFVVRKLGAPENEELAIGAIASGGIRVLNEELMRDLNVSLSFADEAAEREVAEVAEREKLYRGDVPFPSLVNRTVILVDDGLATGATMRAAVRAAARAKAKQVIAAAPVGSTSARLSVSLEADQVVCLYTPHGFTAVGESLRTGAPGSARASILTIASGWWSHGFGTLLYSVQTGKSGFESENERDSGFQNS